MKDDAIELGDVYLDTHGNARLVTHKIVEPIRGVATTDEHGNVMSVSALNYTGPGINRTFLFNVRDVLRMVSK